MRSLSKTRDLQEVERRLQSLQPGDPRLWGEMDVNQMLAHLCGAFRVAMGEMSAGEVPPLPPLPPLPPKLLKFMALQVPMQWPQGLQTFSELKVGAPAMRTGVFEEQRRLLLGEMQRFVRRDQQRVDHAMFGAMSYGDWMRWGYLHTDHHLRQFGR